MKKIIIFIIVVIILIFPLHVTVDPMCDALHKECEPYLETTTLGKLIVGGLIDFFE
jgi:hypothetical protein